MVSQIKEEILAIVSHCDVESRPNVKGWTLDVWHVSPDVVEKIVEAYSKLLIPTDIDEALRNELTDEGVPLSRILTGRQSRAVDTITRADMVEIAAAASLAAVEKAPLSTLSLANVPKGPRDRSEPGLDAIAVVLSAAEKEAKLGPNERLYIVSAKHTIADDLGDVRRKVEQSISSTQLSVAYIGPQLRVYEQRLRAEGMNVSRVYRFLTEKPFLNANHVSLIAVAAVDASRQDDFLRECQRLNQTVPGLRHFRQVLVPDLSELHSLVA